MTGRKLINIIPLLIFILILNLFFTPIFLGSSNTASAAAIDKNDVYAGLGLMFLLVVLSDSNDNGSSAADSIDFYDYNNFTADEIELLAKIIHAESRGESFRGKVAVGAVIINRVYHPSFPNTIKGVIYQSGQFKPVENGMINLSPDNDSMQAAYDAVNGVDPSKGSLYFYNPAKSENPEFFAKRTKIVEIDNHVFLK